MAFSWTGERENSPQFSFRRAFEFTVTAPYSYGVRLDASKHRSDHEKLSAELALQYYGDDWFSVAASMDEPYPSKALFVTTYKGEQVRTLFNLCLLFCLPANVQLY